MAKPEYILSKAVADYLRLQFPRVEYHFDQSGTMMTKAQSGMQKALQKRRGFADLFIMEPRGQYHGCFIELKAEGVRLRKKDGSPAGDHIAEQMTFKTLMLQRGYFATFCVGFSEAKTSIDEYLKLCVK
jgi:hypothetical protein